jgi:hypothetical protein
VKRGGCFIRSNDFYLPKLRLEEELGWEGQHPVIEIKKAGSGSADPSLCLMDSDPDPAFLSLTFKTPTKNNFFKSFPAYYRYFLEVKKKSQNSRNQGFSSYFCLMREGSGSEYIGTVHL